MKKKTAARQIRAAVTPQPQMRQLRLPKLQLQMRVLPMKEKYLTSTAGTKSSRAVLQIIILDIQRWMQPQVRSVM